MDQYDNIPPPKISNVVSSVELGCSLDLEKIFQGGYYRYVEHTNRESGRKKKAGRFTEVLSLGLRGKNTMGRVFKSGKMMCVGEISDEGSRAAARKFARIIQKSGYPEAKFSKFKICNVVASWDVKFRINLKDLSVAHQENCTYNDGNRTHVLYFKMTEPKVTLGIFETGKITLLGAKSDQHVYEACSKILPILQEFRKPE